MIYISFLFITILIMFIAYYQWQYHVFFTPSYFREEGGFCEGSTLLSITTDDGIELEGIVFEPKDAKNTLLFFNGRSHDAVGLINKLAEAYPKSRVVTFNYRSYGKSEGSISERRLLSDALQIAQLIQKHYGDFFVLGYSLGSSIGAYVASKQRVKALFLVGAFDSLKSLVQAKHKYSFFLRYKFPTQEYLQDVEDSLYLFASRGDSVTPLQHSQVLAKKAKKLEYFYIHDSFNHKEILWDKNVIEIINKVLDT